MRHGIQLAFLMLSLLLCYGFGSCQKENKPPDPPQKPLWNIHWSHTPGRPPATLDNNLTDGGDPPVTSTTAWKTILKTGTDYIVETGLEYPTRTPDDATLDYDNANTFAIYLNTFYNNLGGNRGALTTDSYVLGINIPSNIEDDIAGFTFPLGYLQGPLPAERRFAASFVLKARIFSMPQLQNDQQRWLVVESATLHELGHARGIIGNESLEYCSASVEIGLVKG